MKKVQIGLAALAVLCGLGAAYGKEAKTAGTQYEWRLYTAGGVHLTNTYSAPMSEATAEDEICSGDNVNCALATTPVTHQPQGIVIKKF